MLGHHLGYSSPSSWRSCVEPSMSVTLSPHRYCTFIAQPDESRAKKTTKPTVSSGFLDGARRARTADLLGAIQALSQLSYSPGKADCSEGLVTPTA